MDENDSCTVYRDTTEYLQVAFTCLIRCPLCGGHMVGNNRERIRAGVVVSRTYVCVNRKRETDGCPSGKSYAESRIARGVLPFTASVLKQITGKMRDALEATAREMSEDTLRGRMETEIRAEIAECETQENNLARAVALGQIQPDQIGTVSQELTEKKSRLKKDWERLLGQTAIEQEFQAALAELDGDLEQALFKIWKQNPLALNRVLRFIYEKGSLDLKAKGSPRWGRSSDVLDCKFTPEFVQVLDQ